MTENQIEMAILQYLNKKGFFAFKFKDTGSYVAGSYRKPLPFQINGVSDIAIVHQGITYWVEIKTPKGEQSKHQKTFELRITESGAEYLIWRSLNDCKSWANELHLGQLCDN